jgi:hypothetical protein
MRMYQHKQDYLKISLWCYKQLWRFFKFPPLYSEKRDLLLSGFFQAEGLLPARHLGVKRGGY